jgi:hypothetical protein
MQPRHFLLLAPLLLAAGCADQTTSDSAVDTVTVTDAPATGMDGNTNSAQDGSQPATAEQPAADGPVDWDTDGPVDEATVTARDRVFKDLDALRKNGEEALMTKPGMSDAELRDAVITGANVASDVVADGATGIQVTATEGETSCSGVLSFKSGVGAWDGISCS